MSEDKGGEYTKRLSQELKSSLYQRQADPNQEMWAGDVPPADLQVSLLVVLISRRILFNQLRYSASVAHFVYL